MVSKALIIFAIKRAHLNRQLVNVRTSILAVQLRMVEMEHEGVSASRMKIIREKLNFFRSLEYRRMAEMKALYGSYSSRAH